VNNLEIRAKKKFGQNFLKDSSIKRKILEAIPNDNYQTVEIGIGLGDLTEYLLQSKSVVGYEIDIELCDFLKGRFETEIEKKSFNLICGDVLEFWKDASIFEEKYKIVANLPYYIATTIILKALDDLNCTSATVMVQKEVGEKFLAKSGDKNFSSLSVLAGTVGNVEIVTFVPPKSFDPPPKVDSVVIQFKRKNEKKIDEKFKKFLKIAFQQPRKTLLKNLSQKYKKDDLVNIFSEIEISNSIRPHQLETVDYHQIFNTLERLQIGRVRKKRT
jgi:16S rRNA (adenine1518-N6/adenine1519-N6)-dimethyltransferase